eukprot:1007956-Amphidinium_carterae.1
MNTWWLISTVIDGKSRRGQREAMNAQVTNLIQLRALILLRLRRGVHLGSCVGVWVLLFFSCAPHSPAAATPAKIPDPSFPF